MLHYISLVFYFDVITRFLSHLISLCTMQFIIVIIGVIVPRLLIIYFALFVFMNGLCVPQVNSSYI